MNVANRSVSAMINSYVFDGKFRACASSPFWKPNRGFYSELIEAIHCSSCKK
jgi:hypothetical protein